MPDADNNNTGLYVDQIFDDLLYSVAHTTNIVSVLQESQSVLHLESAYFESFMNDNKKVKCRACGYNGRLTWMGTKDTLIGCARCGSKHWQILLPTNQHFK